MLKLFHVTSFKGQIIEIELLSVMIVSWFEVKKIQLHRALIL